MVTHVSTGDMLREAVKQGTPLGKKAKELMDRGELLGDDLIMEMVAERLAESDTRDRGFILDGCPRTVAQARMLADLLAPVDLDLVIDIEVPTSQVLRRLAVAPGVRRLRRQLLPAVPPADQLDVRRLRRRGGPARGRHRGGHLAGGSRSTRRQTAPLIDWYRDRGQLARCPAPARPRR